MFFDHLVVMYIVTNKGNGIAKHKSHVCKLLQHVKIVSSGNSKHRSQADGSYDNQIFTNGAWLRS